ncbi:MAG: Y-family DNA polymerase [Pirellula sp.]
MNASHRRVLSIWLPNWPWQRLAAPTWRQANEPNAQPAAATVLLGQDPRRGRLVCAANATARSLGILPNMTATQAKSIAGSISQLPWEWIEHDPHEDLEEIYGLTERLMQFSPLVGVEPIEKNLWAGRSILQPQSVLMDITGLESWYGGESAMADQLQQWLVGEGLLACIGIADSVGQAWAVSNYAFRKQISDTMLKIEKQELSLKQSLTHCDRVSINEHGPASKTLSDLPIEALRLDIETVAKLHRLGIRNIHSLEALPRQSLTSRFGSRLLDRIDQCLHARSEPISVRSTGEPLEVCLDFEHPIFVLDELQEVIQECVAQVCRKLESIGHGAWRLVVRLGLEVSTMQVQEASKRAVPSHVIQLGLYQSSDDPKHLLWLIQGCLERNPPLLSKNLGIKQVLVQVPWTSPMRWKQNALFDCQTLKYRDEAAKLIDGLTARLGRNQVVGLSLLQDPIPERQTKFKPLTGMRNDGSQQSTERKLRKKPIEDYQNTRSVVPGTDGVWTRPTQLLANPTRIEVECDSMGVPTQTRLATEPNKGIAITQSIGPERIESSWWSGPTLRRNYFRVALDSGTWWWIYQDLSTKQWFLHGLFH